MAGRTRIAALGAAALVAVCALVPVAVPPASAAQPSIDRVDYVRVFSRTPTVVRFRLQAFDHGRAVPFRGTARIAARTGVLGVAAVRTAAAGGERSEVAVRVASRRGGAASVAIDVHRMRAGGVVAIGWRLRAAGDARPYRDVHVPLLSLTRIRTATGWTTAVDAAADPFAGAASGWPCASRVILFGRPACTTDTPVTPAQAEGLGPRLVFAWTPPTRGDGSTYDRCLLQPYLAGEAVTGADGASAPAGGLTAGSEEQALPAIDVPGDWGWYAVPTTVNGALSGLAFGAPLSWTLRCYDSPFDVPTAILERGRIPDLTPPAPDVAVETSAGRIVLQVSGGAARGRPPVAGYRYAVRTLDDVLVRRGVLAAEGDGRTVEQAVLDGLAAGRYRVEVVAQNTVAESDVVRRTVAVAAVPSRSGEIG